MYRLKPKFAWRVILPTSSRVQSFKMTCSGVTILQGVEFPIFLLIFAWALQQCSANALPVMLMHVLL